MEPQRLDAVADITMGQAPEGESYNLDGEGLPLIAGAGDFGELHPEPKKFTTAPGKTCQPGDVVLGIRATIGEKVLADGTYCLGRGVAGLRAKPGLDERYLWHWLTHVAPTLAAKAKGATFKQVNREDIGELRITLPPLPEQRRIAEILDKADALRAKRRAALSHLDTLTQSIFLDMFGDPATNPKGWPITKLGEVISVGPQNGLYRPASDYGSGTPILRIDAFYDGVVTGMGSLKRVRISAEEIALYGLRPGDIVVNRVNSREYLGKSALIPDLSEPTVFESNMMRFGVDAHRLHPVYLIHLLQTRHVRAHILRASKDAVNQSSINQQDVKSIPVVLPPLPQQEFFAQYVRASQVLAAAHRSSAVALDSLFASLQGQAFAGDP
jgi:type I restriction enzyme S subunit